MDSLFRKCEQDTRAEAARRAGVYPYFHRLESRQDVEVVMDGRRRIMLGSNNYLGLTTCPEVVEAGIKALEKYGTGCSGSRFLNGTLDLHLELEAELADFLGKEEALTFGTGFQTNLGAISAHVGRHDHRLSAPRIRTLHLLRADSADCDRRHAGDARRGEARLRSGRFYESIHSAWRSGRRRASAYELHGDVYARVDRRGRDRPAE